MWDICLIYALTKPELPRGLVPAAGMPATRTIYAPRNALVLDSNALEQRLEALKRRNLSDEAISEALTRQGMPTIEVSKGDLITREGALVSSVAMEVLQYFGLALYPELLTPRVVEGVRLKDCNL